MNETEENPKLAKKLAKAAAKAAKKKAKLEHPGRSPAGAATSGRSPAERSAEAAERQVALQRWRVVLAVVGAIIAFATLLVVLLGR
ncbi:MAG: hypothetical protein ACE5I3_02450 [Phycisphaerae bacterium]